MDELYCGYWRDRLFIDRANNLIEEATFDRIPDMLMSSAQTFGLKFAIELVIIGLLTTF